MFKNIKDTVAEIQYKLNLTHEEIAKRVGYTRPYLTAAIKNNTKGKILDKLHREFTDILKGDSEVSVNTSISKEIAGINERLITLEAMARISNMNLFEIRAKVFGTSFSSEVLTYEGNVSKEINKIFDELRRKKS